MQNCVWFHHCVAEDICVQLFVWCVPYEIVCSGKLKRSGLEKGLKLLGLKTILNMEMSNRATEVVKGNNGEDICRNHWDECCFYS